MGTCLQAGTGLGRQSKQMTRLDLFTRLVWYAGVGLLVVSVAALAIRYWLPESFHMGLFLLLHSLSAGVVLMLVLRSLGKAKASGDFT